MTERQAIARLRHRAVLVVVLAGCGAFVAAGGIVAVLGMATAVAAAAGRLWPEPRASWGDSLTHVNRVVALLVLIGALGGLPLVELAVAFVGWLQVHRAWAGRAPAHDRVALLLAVLMLLLGCILGISAWLAPIFAVFALLVPIVLALCHLGEEEDHRPARLRPLLSPRGRLVLAGLAPISVLGTLAFYALIPRLEVGAMRALAARQQQVGIGEDVSLGQLGEIKDNPAVVMRVVLRDAAGEAPRGPFYFRGSVFDRFDGRRWTSSVAGHSRVESQVGLARPRGDDVVQEILLEPVTEGVLFSIPDAVGLAMDDGAVYVDPNGTWTWYGIPRRLRYTVLSRPSARPDSGRALVGVDPAYTQLPPGLDPRIEQLAAGIADPAGPDAMARALALEAWLAANLEYDLSPSGEDKGRPLSDFLFESRRGHCEYFATALAVMLRTQGIPSRMATGLYGGAYNGMGGYLLLRQSDAHAWVEVGMESGWVPLDATPAGSLWSPETSWAGQAADWLEAWWYTVIMDFDLFTQVEAVRWAGSRVRRAVPEGMLGEAGDLGLGLSVAPLALVAGLAARALLGLLGGARRPRDSERAGFAAWWARWRAGSVLATHRRARRLVESRGWQVPQALPPVEAAQWLALRAGPLADPLLELAWLSYRVRYAGEPDRTLAPAAQAAYRELSRLPHRRGARR